ncbi:MAG TPA: FAD-dependent oxidoreductase [Burkholderiales bacterium]|nr:FAD-dependent oxidoreductase [Burkholderiales bacterium]
MGCIPTKTLAGSAKAMHTAARGAEFGFRASKVEADWSRIRARKDQVVGGIVADLAERLERNPRITLIHGWAQFLDAHRLAVGDRVVAADRIILASGVVPRVPDIPGLRDVDYLTNETILEMDTLPDSLLIVGGGPEGMEFGQIFRRFGVRVAVLQRRDRVLPREDPDISHEVAHLLRDEGVEIYTNTVPTLVTRTPSGVAVQASVDGHAQVFEARRILLAAGRAPHGVAQMKLATAGIEGDSERGVRVDEGLRTTAPHVWAIGDVMGRMQHQHFSVYTGRLAARNAVSGAGLKYDTAHIPGAVFTDPEVARVGLTVEEALKRGHRVKVGQQPVAAISRAQAIGETRGFIKLVVDADTDRLLGMHVLAPMGADLLPQGVLMMRADTVASLQNIVYIHPTLSEGLKAAIAKVESAAPAATHRADEARTCS